MADNSSALGVVGTAPVRLTLGGITIVQELVFTEKLAYDLIVGVDVLAELGCGIDYARRTIKTERSKINFECSHDSNSVVAALQETTTVEPGSVKGIWTKRPPEFTGEIMIECIQKQVVDYRCNDSEDLPIMIINTRRRKLTLGKDTPLYKLSKFEEQNWLNAIKKLDHATIVNEKAVGV